MKGTNDMTVGTIKNDEQMTEKIRKRREELGLTVEEAAKRAGVETANWCRYEAGDDISRDEYPGVLKALELPALTEEREDEAEEKLSVEEYREKPEWPHDIAETFGDVAALSFVAGSEMLLDDLDHDLEELASLPAGTHLGQLPVSLVVDYLPAQFLMRYDYDFLYTFRTTIHLLVERVKHGNPIIAHSVMEELALVLIVKEADSLLEMELEADREDWSEWIYDVFEDADVLTWLYSDLYVKEGQEYHFDRWMERQFLIRRKIVKNNRL